MSKEILDAINNTKEYFVNTIAKKDQEMKDLTDQLNAIKNNVSDYNSTKEQVEQLEAQIKMAPVNNFNKMENIEGQYNKFTETKDELNNVTGRREKVFNIELGASEFLNPTQRKMMREKIVPFNAVNPTNANQGIQGSSVGSEGLYTTLLEGNFARNYGTVLPVSSSSFKIPNLSEIMFSDEPSVLDQYTGAQNNSSATRSRQGTIGSRDVIIGNAVAQVNLSKPVVEDIPALDSLVMNAMMMGASKREGMDAVGVLDAYSINETTTITVNNFGDASKIIPKLADLVSKLGNAYVSSPNCRFYVSREAYAKIRGSANTTLNFDSSQGVFTIFGYPVVISDYLDAGGTANDLSVYFGDMSRGLIFATRRDLSIGRYYETSPGYVVYFGDVRSKSAVWDSNALVRLKTVAN